MGIKIICLSLIPYLLFGGTTFSQDSIDAAKQTASDLGTTFTTNYRSQSNVNSKVYNPMSSDTEASTLDGSKHSTINITCADSVHPYARITYTGISDINVNVKLDLNQDGVFEQDQNFNGISGVHTNGVAVCDTDTFNNCSYYSWQFDTTNSSIFLQQVPFEQITSVYCINHSCGDLSLLQRSRILNDLVGAIGNTLQQSSQNLVITRTLESTNYTDLYGQDYSTCQDSSNVIYNASSGVPDEATLQSQAAAEQTPTNPTYKTLLDYSDNETNINPIDAADTQDIQDIAQHTNQNVSVDQSNPNNISYENKYKDADGNWVTQTDSATIQFDSQPQSQSCMIEYEEQNTQVTGDQTVVGHDGTGSGEATTKKTEVRECVDNYTVCPLNAGETIKYDCGHMSDSIVDSLKGIETVKQMQSDLSCATN